MNKRTLNALWGSISKWEGIVAGTVEDRGPNNCPLCHKFNKAYVNKIQADRPACTGCPVFAHTGKDFCEGTPYADWESVDPDDEGSDEKLAHYAKAEVEFLRSLLPEETSE